MYRFYVTGNEQLTATTLLLTLKKAPEQKPFSFQSGQYATISFKVNGRPTPSRNFSIVNSSTDQGILQFSIRVNGRFTTALNKLQIGEEVKVRGPFGTFVFDKERDKDTVFIAGGIGIAPFMSMIRYATITKLPNKISLLYGCKTQDDIPFINQIKQFEQQNPNFKSLFSISSRTSDKLIGLNVNNGSVTPEIIDQVVNNSYEGKTFLICGHPHFMDAMAKNLINRGVPADYIMTEAFSQGTKHQKGKIFSWPLNVYTLGAVGLAATSFMVMVSDLVKTLPAATSLDLSNTADPLSTGNSRQSDLDELVNGLPAVNSKNPASDAVVNNAKQSTASNTTPAQSTNTGTSTTPIVVTPTPTPTPAPTQTPTPTPAPTPAPKPVPVCTTTQSGVTTCV